jgi:hypothetical protein
VDKCIIFSWFVLGWTLAELLIPILIMLPIRVRGVKQMITDGFEFLQYREFMKFM